MQERNSYMQSETEKAQAVVAEIERRALTLSESLTLERDRADHVQADADRQTREIEQLHVDLATERQQREKVTQAERQLATELASVQATNAGLIVQLAETKKHGEAEREKISRTGRELMTELATARATSASLSEQLADVKKRGATEILRIGERSQKVEAEREEARKEAKEAAVAASKLSGQVETLRQQVESQTAMIKGFTVQADKKAK